MGHGTLTGTTCLLFDFFGSCLAVPCFTAGFDGVTIASQDVPVFSHIFIEDGA